MLQVPSEGAYETELSKMKEKKGGKEEGWLKYIECSGRRFR
jgi:hypothetical protein